MIGVVVGERQNRVAHLLTPRPPHSSQSHAVDSLICMTGNDMGVVVYWLRFADLIVARPSKSSFNTRVGLQNRSNTCKRSVARKRIRFNTILFNGSASVPYDKIQSINLCVCLYAVRCSSAIALFTFTASISGSAAAVARCRVAPPSECSLKRTTSPSNNRPNDRSIFYAACRVDSSCS